MPNQMTSPNIIQQLKSPDFIKSPGLNELVTNPTPLT